MVNILSSLTPGIPVTAEVRTVCPKCAVIMQTGQISCCARDGAWFGECGDEDDLNFGYTWGEGIEACNAFVSLFSVKEEAPPKLIQQNTSAQHPNNTLRSNLGQEGNAQSIIAIDTDSAGCAISFSVFVISVHMYMQIQFW